MRLGTLLVVALFALPLVAPAPCLAAGGAHDKEGKGHEKGGKHTEKEKENINVFKGGLDLTIWTIAVFLILFFILSTFAWPQIRAGLDKRESDIARDRMEADKAKKEAADLRGVMQSEITKAHNEARGIVEKASADARASAADELARGKQELAAEKERLHTDVARERDQALQEVWSQGAELAALISAKVIGRSLSLEDHRALLAQALDEFKAAARNRVSDLTSARQ